MLLAVIQCPWSENIQQQTISHDNSTPFGCIPSAASMRCPLLTKIICKNV